MIYLDTSALLKLVLDEGQSEAVRAFLAERAGEPLVSSVLLTIETRRAVLREAPAQLPRADLLLTRVGQIGVSHGVVEGASRLPDRMLRSLDAIHLATALLLGDELSAFVAYDKRLLATAREHHLPATSPA